MGRRRGRSRPTQRTHAAAPASTSRLSRLAGLFAAAVLTAVATHVTGLAEKVISGAVALVRPTDPVIVTGQYMEGTPSPPAPSATTAAAQPMGDAPAKPTRKARTGKIVESRYECGRGASGLIVARPAEDIGPPKGDYDDSYEVVPRWIEQHDAADRNETFYQVEIQGKPGKSVILRRMYIDFVGRAEPPSTATVVQLQYEECGDVLQPRYFTTSLDDRSGRWRPEPGTPDFPYRISTDGPEVFRLSATTTDCDCRWRIALEWVSGGKTGTTYVDETFHTAPDRDYPRIAWNVLDGPWEPMKPDLS
jgi:hypothetical protein